VEVSGLTRNQKRDAAIFVAFLVLHAVELATFRDSWLMAASLFLNQVAIVWPRPINPQAASVSTGE
jgi:hypothetical protein